ALETSILSLNEQTKQNINIRTPATDTTAANKNEIIAASVFVRPLVDVQETPKLRIKITSNQNPSKFQEIDIPIKIEKQAVGLPEFHLPGLIQIISIALALLFIHS
ncbi:hypothetical protein HZB88_00280, partial [archaeon]|nr:hypothetical protein [archaeon]